MTKLLDVTNMTPGELSTVPAQRLKLATLRALSNAALMNAAGALRAYTDALNEGLPGHVTDAAIWDALIGQPGTQQALQAVVQQAVESVGLPEGALLTEVESRALENIYSQVQAGAFVENLEAQAQADGRWARDLADSLTDAVKRVA
jgi:hypothetical protein